MTTPSPQSAEAQEREFEAHLLQATWHQVMVQAKDDDDEGASIYRMCRMAAREAWNARSFPPVQEAEARDAIFLSWLADRLVNVYGENANVDFVLATRRIAASLSPSLDDLAPTGELVKWQERTFHDDSTFDEPRWGAWLDCQPPREEDARRAKNLGIRREHRALYAGRAPTPAVQEAEAPNFCARCGKRLGAGIHTCSLPREDEAGVKLPSTALEVIEFIGSNFDSLKHAVAAEDTRYSLTVHDLLSAFRDLADQAPTPAVEGLTAAARRLEEACNQRAALLTREAYLAAEAIPGMRDVLDELDTARKDVRIALAASQVPMAGSAGEPCHNCGGLGYRREANGEQIPCDLCQDALEPVRARIEQAIREHCEGGDLWMVSHIAAKAITAPPAASLREQERTEVYAEGRSDQYADDGAVVRLLLENCDDADKESDGRMNTTRIRELLTHFDDAQRLGRGKDGAA